MYAWWRLWVRCSQLYLEHRTDVAVYIIVIGLPESKAAEMCKMGRAAAPALATNVVLENLAKIVSCSFPGNGAVKGDPLQTMVGARSGAFD